MAVAFSVVEYRTATAAATNSGINDGSATNGVGGGSVGGVFRQGLCTSWLEQRLRHTDMLMADDDTGGEKSNKGNGNSNGGEGNGDDNATGEGNGESSGNGIFNEVEVEVECSLKRGTDFTLPADSKVPVVMIGPGTGVAPFVGFIQVMRRSSYG
jgi:sulfite reductase alpha subunit-like flavoprotein